MTDDGMNDPLRPLRDFGVTGEEFAAHVKRIARLGMMTLGETASMDGLRCRPHRYHPPLQYVVQTEPLAFTDDPDPTPRVPNHVIGQIHCGPPADQPRVPSPEEILRGADGLGRSMLMPQSHGW